MSGFTSPSIKDKLDITNDYKDVAGFSAKYVKQVIHKGLETDNSKKFLKDLQEEISKAKENNTVVQERNIQKLGED